MVGKDTPSIFDTHLDRIAEHHQHLNYQDQNIRFMMNITNFSVVIMTYLDTHGRSWQSR